MKYFIFILISLHQLSLFSQATQKGLVRELNSKNRPIDNVSVNFYSAASTVSDINGKFILTFTKQKENGDYIIPQTIEKPGYEVVNDNELNILRFSSDGFLPTDIIMAKEGVIEDAKRQYADASYELSKKAYNTRLEKLKTQLVEAKINENTYRKSLQKLHSDFETLQKKVDELSSSFARINFDDYGLEYQEALSLFKNGKLEEAIFKMESLELEKQTEKALKEKNRILIVENKIVEDKNLLNSKINRLLKMLGTQLEFYKLEFDYGKAENILNQLLKLDSTNVEILQKAGDFYRENHKYDKAINLYQKIISLPNVEPWRRANTYDYLGELFLITGDLTKALEKFQLFNLFYSKTPKEEKTPFHRSNLAISFSKLGSIYMDMGNIKEAMNFFLKQNQIFKTLDKESNSGLFLKNDLATSYEKLGIASIKLGNLKNALIHFEKFYDLTEKLRLKFPLNINARRDLVISYQWLGVTNYELGNLNDALFYFEKQYETVLSLVEEYPYNISLKSDLAVSLEKLGSVNKSLGNSNKALDYFQDFNEIAEDLQNKFPENIEFKSGLAISNNKLGLIYLELGKPKDALKFLQQSIKLEKDVLKTAPLNLDFKLALAVANQDLGIAYNNLNEPTLASQSFETFFKLAKELHLASPQSIKFKNAYAYSSYLLGKNKMITGNKQLSLKYLELYWKIQKELYLDFPKNPQHKNDLGTAMYYLGSIHADLGKLNKAQKYLRNYRLLKEELHQKYPNDKYYKNGLAISYSKLASYYRNHKKDEKLSIEFFKKARSLWLELLNSSPEDKEFKRNLNWANSQLKNLEE